MKNGTNEKFDDLSVKCFNDQLKPLGLAVKEVVGDGNCLFRALADQLDGNSSKHLTYRQEVCDYILFHRSDFEPFFDADENFEAFIEDLRKPGKYGGNEVLVAFSRLKNVNIIIHQISSMPWRILCSQPNAELQLCYHTYEHYSSVKRIHRSSSQSRRKDKISISSSSSPLSKSISGKSSGVLTEDTFDVVVPSSVTALTI